MDFEVVLHLDYMDPPTTFTLMGIDGPNATLALKRNMDKVVLAAQKVAGIEFDEQFTERDLAKQIYVLLKGKRWLAAKDVIWNDL